MMTKKIKNLLITFFLSAFTFAPVLAGAVQNKLSSSEIYLKVMSASEQIKNLNLSQDSVRLLRMSDGRSENLKSLLQLESASIQREEGRLVDRYLVYSFIRDSIYQGTAKEELLPLLESSSSAKISFYQKMLNVEIGRIMHLSDPSSRQKRVQILNRNLNVLKALIEREKKL